MPSSTRMTTRDNTTKVEGIITEETEKELFLKLETGHENWFPKSNIKSHYSSEKEILQIFLIDSWILERKKIA
jgi:hypothetical protein